MLKHLTDQQVLKDTKLCVLKERAATLQVLEHIQEVHKRKLYAELGFPSLFKYLVAELNYSESQAYRRIQAARLIDTVPEARLKIASGSLNLSNATKPQSFFSEQKTLAKEKLQLINQVEHKTTRACEQILEQIKNPNHAPSFHLNLKLSETQKQKWDALANRLAHHNLGKEALLEKALDLVLEELDPLRPKRGYQTKKDRPTQASDMIKDVNTKTTASVKSSSSSVAQISELGHAVVAEAALTTPVDLTTQRLTLQAQQTKALALNKNASHFKRSIPANIKRELYLRSQGKCEWKQESKACHSSHALQIDHIIPYALGGETSLQNLQVFCRAHHQRKTVEEYGIR